MKKALFELLNSNGQLTPQSIFLRLFVASVLAGFIYLSYMISHNGSIYSRKFNVSLAALTIITTTVMIVIGNNLALSLGMVGALSIVRFRTAIKDSRDTVYIFWTIVAGICCGAGDFTVASLGSAFIFFVFLLFGRIKTDNRILLIIRTSLNHEEAIEALIFEFFNRKAILRVKNSTENSVEFIYEISHHLLAHSEKTAVQNGRCASITRAIYEIGEIDYCNLVVQNDEISG